MCGTLVNRPVYSWTVVVVVDYMGGQRFESPCRHGWCIWIYRLQRWQLSFPWVSFFATLWKLRFPIYFAFGFKCSVVVSAGLQREDNQNSSWCDDGPSPPHFIGVCRTSRSQSLTCSAGAFLGGNGFIMALAITSTRAISTGSLSYNQSLEHDHLNTLVFGTYNGSYQTRGWNRMVQIWCHRCLSIHNISMFHVSGGPPRFPKPRPWQGCWG